MVSKSAIKDTPALIKRLLTDRFGATDPITEYLCPIITTFASSNCSDKHFMSEICSRDDGKFWSRTWEAVLYARLIRCEGWSVSSRGGGMDFLVTNGEQSVLVDAIVPAPEGIPCEWLTEHGGVYSMPDDKILLRWTHSIYEKQKKHISDVKKGAVSALHPFVIAINSCRLSRFPDDHGITQWPFAVEAVFPVGPIVVPIDKGAKKCGNAFQSLRFSVQIRDTDSD